MFERFTDRARQTVVLAQAEARNLKHNYIGTEHILLGLLAEGGGVAARALGKLGIVATDVRDAVTEIVGRGEQPPGGHIPFTPRAKKVLELSLREALKLKHNYIGTEHILLGLLREGEGVAAQVLVGRGADLDNVRAAVLAELASGGAEPVAPSDRTRRTPAAEQVFAVATRLAGSAPVGSHHLLEALARSEDSLAAKVLAAAGVDPDALAAKIDELGLEGTSDLTPEQAAARQMEVRIDGDEVHVVLRDDATVALVRELAAQLGGDPVRDDPVAAPLVGLHQAVARALEELRDRVSPPAESSEAESGGGITAVIGRAMRARLQRRRRANPGA